MPPALVGQCSNPTCRATFTAPVQQCLTCGALLIGKLLNERFRIDLLLGRGGMGAVYRATDLALGRQVAVKVLAPSAGLAGDAPDQLRARFFREARLAAQLDHPNIVAILHFDIDGPLAYLVMPLLTGGTLARRIHPKQPTDPVTVAGWLRQVASALDYAHTRPQPIVHRDVKPGNLLFHEDGRLCLADFGIARVVSGSESSEAAHLTRTGVVIGSLAYMAPEQINGRAVPASDQYSVGIMLYELLTGSLPFEASDSYGLIIQHASVRPIPPSERVPGLPPGLDAVILRALAKEPTERFPTVGALAEAFSDALSKATTSQYQGLPQPRATAPIAPRPTLALPDSPGDLPTQAATKRRFVPASAAVSGTFPGGTFPMAVPPGAPPQPLPQPPRHRRRNWVIGISSGLLALCLCIGVLAALSKQGQSTKSNAAATGTAAAPSPKPTQSDAERYRAILLAAEKNQPFFRDALLSSDHNLAWIPIAPAHFGSDGLNLPSHQVAGKERGGQFVVADNAALPLHELYDIEVNVSFTGANVDYGLIFPASAEPSLALALNTGGAYAAVALYNDQNKDRISDLTTDPDLTLTPATVYHLEVLLQSNQFVVFLNKRFLATVRFTPAFTSSNSFGLYSYADAGNPAANVIFRDLTLYPLS